MRLANSTVPTILSRGKGGVENQPTINNASSGQDLSTIYDYMMTWSKSGKLKELTRVDTIIAVYTTISIIISTYLNYIMFIMDFSPPKFIRE
jgi:hypothetical protein